MLATASTLPGMRQALASESTYTCINNSDGTATCVRNDSGRELTCTTSGVGVRTCVDRQSGQQLNCLVNNGGTISCTDPETKEKLECQGTGMGENACRSFNGRSKPAELITEPSLFNGPKDNDTQTLPGLPKVIELPSAF